MEGVRVRVTKNSVIKIAYTVEAKGDMIDSSPDSNPFEFYCGCGQLVPGFERALMGLRAGEQKDFTVAAADAYGEHDSSLVKTVPRTSLPASLSVTQGMRIPMRSPEGVELVCKILDVGNEAVVADFNHPLAGAPLNCSVRVLDVRAAN
ncbi:MAG: FKBP-type peptidyl-prolyl cis-trans isomerase 2 [Myxococcota bacterium]